jgi:heat shock protein HslJ
MNKLMIALIALVVAGIVGGTLMWNNDAAANAGDAQAANQPGVGELASTSWILTEITNAAGSRAPVAGSEVTLDFGADGRATGNATCNRYMGPFTQAGNAVGFGPMASTMMACMQDGWSEQEFAYLQALEAITTAQIDGDTLILSGADVELRFTQA